VVRYVKNVVICRWCRYYR